MISTKVAGIASGKLHLIIQAKICKRIVESESFAHNQNEADNFLNLMYRNLLADTVMRFLKQRKQALRHFRIPDLKAENTVQLLFARFENANQLSLYELAKRIVISEPLFQRILPSESSRFASWNETICSAYSMCTSILKLRDTHPDRRLSLSEFINI